MDRPPQRSSPALAFAIGLALAGVSTTALAQPAPAPSTAAATELTGSVIGLDGDDLILDVGAADGLAEGAVVELWRPIKIKHPVTGKVLTDRFRIGSLEINQARKSMSLAAPSGTLLRKPERGDVVLTERGGAAKASPTSAATSVGGATAPELMFSPDDVEARAIGVMLAELTGADLSTRIRRYEELARTRPQGKYTRTLVEEAAALRQLLDPARARPSHEPAAPKRPQIVSFTEPKNAVAGAPLRLGIELRGPLTGGVLHARDTGAPSYRSFPMTSEGKGYWGATLPGERLNAPGVEYFIEGIAADGHAESVVGSSENPRSIEVHPVPKASPPKRLDATVSLATELADYNRLRGNDRVWQTEGFFGMRFGDTGVRAVRSGFGVYRGIGGSIHELDVLHRAGRSVGLTYGYLETEIGLTRSFSLLGRLAVGLLDDGIAAGGQALLRIGSDRATNLLLGGEFLGGIGIRTFAQLELAVFPRFPILVRSEVSNQPAGSGAFTTTPAGVAQDAGQVGARGIAQLGWKALPTLTLAVRGSFQGRTINHAGPGIGAGVTYAW
ncbi:MAG: hypothetical protein ABJE95_37610 [Byssovorax sp.]